MDICPAKNGLQEKMTKNRKKGNSYKQRLTSGFDKSIFIKNDMFPRESLFKVVWNTITNAIRYEVLNYEFLFL